MIFTQSRQQGVTQGQLRFRKVTANEIRLRGAQIPLFQDFAGEQKTSAAVKQEPRRFGNRNCGRVKVMLAAGKDSLLTQNHPMRREEVVTEHRDLVLAKFPDRIDFEFDVDPDAL